MVTTKTNTLKHRLDDFNFGQWLKTIREQRNLPLNMLAELAGVDGGLLSHIEHGKVMDVTLHTAVLVCQALAISDQEFAAIVGVPYVEPDTVAVDMLWEILRPYVVVPRREKRTARRTPNRHLALTQRYRAHATVLEPEAARLSHALWLSTYDKRVFGLLWALTARRLENTTLTYFPLLPEVLQGCVMRGPGDTPVYHLTLPATPPYDQKVLLADGNDATQRRDLVVPVRVYVDHSGVTLQLPSSMTVTVEHYKGQVQMLFWTAEDAGNDPTFKYTVDTNLAATEPAE